MTEELYLVDLVAAMLRLANGDREVMGELAAAEPRGYAVEARVYAEDPSKEYRPSPGRITEVVLPDGVRVDGWVEAGTEVTAAYDPLLAKVVAWAPTRRAAFDRLGAALADTRIAGIETNLRPPRRRPGRSGRAGRRPHHGHPGRRWPTRRPASRC